MAKSAHKTAPVITPDDEVILTDAQLAAYHNGGITLIDDEGNFLDDCEGDTAHNDDLTDNLTPSRCNCTQLEALTDARDQAQQSLSFLTSMLGQNPAYLELEAPAVMGLSNILEDINHRLSV